MMTTVVGHYFGSTIGRKQLVAITGLLLCGFLVSHLAGNFLLMVGPEAFNLYGYKLASLGAALYVIEGILAIIFAVHMGLAIKLNIENLAARGGSKRYALKKNTGRGSTIMSLTMPYTGLILLAFLITHIWGIKLTPVNRTVIDGIEMRDLYLDTMMYFQNIGVVIWYVIAMTAAAMHTAHGVASAFQSMGWNHPKYYKTVKCVGYGYAILIAGGFAFLAVWAHLKGV